MDVILNSKGNSAKRRNHTVPKALLKNWMQGSNGDSHHFVLDCNTAQIKRSLGRDAKFAITDWRYVPVDERAAGNPHRDESLEDWFSKGENYLASVTKKILNKVKVTNAEYRNLVAPAIALGFRSSYEYGLKEDFFRNVEPSLTDSEVGFEVVQYFKSLYQTKISQFSSWDFSFLFNDQVNLLIGDRPLFDMTLHESNTEAISIPLAPNLLMEGRPRKKKSKQSFRPYQAPRSIFEQRNDMTVKLAREFIVGCSAEELSIRLPMFDKEKYNERRSADSLVFFSGDAQLARYKIPSDEI